MRKRFTGLILLGGLLFLGCVALAFGSGFIIEYKKICKKQLESIGECSDMFKEAYNQEDGQNLFDIHIWAPVIASLSLYSLGVIQLILILYFILRGRIRNSYISSIILIVIALFICIDTIYFQVVQSNRGITGDLQSNHNSICDESLNGCRDFIDAGLIYGQSTMALMVLFLIGTLFFFALNKDENKKVQFSQSRYSQF